MPAPINNLDELIRTMQPVINPGIYYFTNLKQQNIPLSKIVATIWEEEGLSAIVREEVAEEYGLEKLFKSAWITLNVHSDLSAVGLTAAFSTALGQAGISCNVVAGAFHDHIFVPYEQKDLAMKALISLQQNRKSAVREK